MRRELFEDVVDPSVCVGPHTWYSVPLSIVSHAAIVAILVIVPLTATNVLPTPQSVLAFATPPPPLPVPPRPVVRRPTPVATAVERPVPGAAPLEAPDRIAEEPTDVPVAGPPPTLGPLVSSPGTSMDGGATGLLQFTTPVSPRPIPVGGNVREPHKLHHVAPVYPPIARAARREGTVILEATIATDGRVTDVRVLRSSNMFDEAAIDAVRQWRYTTPTLNGAPVAVTMTVTVRFGLH